MAGVIPNVEEGRILANYVRNDISCRLYSNNYTPLDSSTLANFTSVAGGGYAAITLDSGDWTTTLGDPTQIVHAEIEYTFTGATTAPSTVYGYYLVDTVTGLMIGAERFPAAVLPFTPVAGSTIAFTPLILAA
jgi:hypothetical protein